VKSETKEEDGRGSRRQEQEAKETVEIQYTRAAKISQTRGVKLRPREGNQKKIVSSREPTGHERQRRKIGKFIQYRK
jgi:hypothetical protein